MSGSLPTLNDLDTAREEYAKLREKMGTRQKKSEWDRLVQAAGFFLLNCHEDLAVPAQALVMELGQRESLMMLHGGFLPEDD